MELSNETPQRAPDSAADPAGPASAPAAKKPSAQERLKHLLEEYGPVAFGVWAVIALLVFGGAALALHLGMDIQSTRGTAGTFAGAYVVYQVTKPLRLLGVFALTPLVARVLRRTPRAAPKP